MNKRQIRIDRIEAVLKEYFAAETAAELLGAEMKADPSFGRRRGWDLRAGRAFVANLEKTYLIRMYAEFEDGLREYWHTYRRKASFPKMEQLLNSAIPTQLFPQDTIDRADDVREYRNSLVHGIGDDFADGVLPVTLIDAKSRLCAYIACFDPNWR